MLPGCKPRTVPPRSILGSSTERTQGAYTTSAHTAGRPSGQHISPRRRIPEGTYPLRRIDSPRISVIILKMNLYRHIACGCIAAMAFTTTSSAMAEDKNDFDYVVDRFADIEVLRYPVPDFDKLSLSQKNARIPSHRGRPRRTRHPVGPELPPESRAARHARKKYTQDIRATATTHSSRLLRNTSNRYGSPTASTTTTRWTNSPRNSPESGLCRSS